MTISPGMGYGTVGVGFLGTLVAIFREEISGLMKAGIFWLTNSHHRDDSGMADVVKQLVSVLQSNTAAMLAEVQLIRASLQQLGSDQAVLKTNVGDLKDKISTMHDQMSVIQGAVMANGLKRAN